MLDAAVEEWHAVDVGEPDVLARVGEMVRVHDEPVATATWLSHWVLSRARCRRRVRRRVRRARRRRAERRRVRVLHHALRRPARRRPRGRARRTRSSAGREYHDHPIFRKDARGGRGKHGRADGPAACRGASCPTAIGMLRYAEALTPDLRAELERFQPVMDEPFDSLPPEPLLPGPRARDDPAAACARRTATRPRSACATSTRSSTTAWSS